MKTLNILSLFLLITNLSAQGLSHKTLKTGKLTTFFFEEYNVGEGARIAEITHKMCSKYISISGIDTLKMPFVQLELWHDFTETFEPFHTVMFDTISDQRSKMAKGLKVVVRDKFISPLQMLKLMKLGLDKFDHSSFEDKLNDELVYETLKTEADGIIKDLKNDPFFRPTKPWLPEIRYAYFDDKFYFLKPELDISVFGHDDIEHFWSNAYLQTNTLTEILGNHKTGALVFNSDSSFFYVPCEGDDIVVEKESIVLPKLIHRKPVKRAVFEKNSLKKVLIYLEDSENLEIKHVYLPLSKKVIPFYDQLEEERLLMSLNQTQVNMPKSNESDTIVNIIIAFVVFLALTIVAVIAFKHYYAED
ncbi:MAG: hypothetical protein SNJ77_04830 [Cytophagales bacterium]